MNKGIFTMRTVALLFFGLFTTQALAQDFCKATHSGTSTKQTLSFGHGSDGNKTGNIGDYHYEVWTKSGNAEATFYSDGSFSCSFSNIDDYLCREGIFYGRNSGKDPLSVGHIYADFSMSSFKNNGGISYAYVGIYGWMQNPLIEWYIVDNWGPASRPGWLGTSQGEVTIAGDVYEIFTADANRASIEGSGPFKQIYSLRKTARNCGTIDITAHFQAWKNKGITLGTSLYEAKILGEAGQYPENGNASGSIDFNYAKVYISNSSTPNSSSSTVQSSSSQNLSVVGDFPGTIEFEDYQNSDGELENHGTGLGNIKPGAWVEFKVDVKQSGVYDFDLSAAREDDQGRTVAVDISLDKTAIGSVDVLTTGWNKYETFSGTTPSLTAGEHTLRVTFTGGYVNVDKITFTKHSSSSSSSSSKPSSSSVAPSSSSVVPSSSSVVPSSSSVVPPSSSSVPVVVVNLPGSIEFEAYQNSGGDFATNANSLGSINPNSWVEYTVNFTVAGYYDFEVMAARQDNDGNKSYLTIAIDGTDIGTVTDILTTSWTDFQPFSGTSTKEIAAGEHTLRVTFDYGWIDADKITFTKKEESSSSVVPPSSSSIVTPSSSSVEPPPSSSSEVPPSSSSVEPPPSSSSEVPPSSSSVVPSSSSVVTPSSSSVIPPSSSSIELPPSSSSAVPPSSSSEVIASSETVEPPSSSSEVSSSSEITITSSEVITPLSSATVEILYSSSSFFSSDSNGPVELVYGPIVQIEPVVNQTTEAIGNIRMTLSDRNVQVFDVQGRNLGLVRVSAGTSLEDALFAKFHRPGIYLVKQGSRMMKVRVSR